MYLEVQEGHILIVYVKDRPFMSNHAFPANTMKVPLKGLTNMPIRVAFGKLRKGLKKFLQMGNR